ncbi:MAG: single-stranded-DNA-specific exonuclease RecJ, partial [Planctomycetes bacterium]|nr:single-stranded-DNA-specific exonuclease RecJ [Planctomycetota bacterium]
TKRWIVPETDASAAGRLAAEVGCSTVMASLLLRRGITDGQSAARFLDPKLTHLDEPQSLPGLAQAARRIEEGIRRRERVAIFGDYDADGISSTCLLVDFFRLLDYPVEWRLPHRLEEGYGLREGIVRELGARGIQLLITVDNGSSSWREVDLARELGMDVVVTDHHQPTGKLPDAAAVVNPWLRSDGKFRDLAGVGVAFKLVWALCQRFSRAKKLSPELREFLLDSLGLVALGTVADVVTLQDENRVLVKHGLRALQGSRRPGVRRLVDAAMGASRRSAKIRARHIAFGLGPRINAVGRLGRADIAMRLLLTEREDEASELISTMERENERRRQVESEILQAARQRVRDEVDLSSERVIVLGDPAWHPGVIGIAAARIVEEFYRPTLLVSMDPRRLRGSARSIRGVHITAALEQCREHLRSFGGHEMAAGFEVLPGRLDDLRRALGEAVPLPPSEMVPAVEADCRVELSDITPALLQELLRLAPFGEGNREPVLAALDLDVVGSPRPMGADGQHLSFFVREGKRVLRAVAFGKGCLASRLTGRGVRVSLLFRAVWNEWQGRREIELNVSEIDPLEHPAIR